MNKLFSRFPTEALLATGLCFVLLSSHPARADAAPDWLRQLAHAPLPKYPDDADAVVLLDDETLTVKDNGDMYVNYRRAVKILRPAGKEQALFYAHFDKETKLDYLHGWSIAANGQEYEMKDKDATETSPYQYATYSDTKVKFIRMPAAEVGAYVAVEYQQRCRPYAFSRKWRFQEDVPVKTARFAIDLPPGWEYQYRFGNWLEQKPQRSGANSWQWEMHDIDGITEERQMPAWSSMAGVMAVSFYSASLPQSSRVTTWNEVAAWANLLNASRRTETPTMRQKVDGLIAGKTDFLSKLRAIASYVQHNVRYVEISIGIGGWQSHLASDTFTNSYGDCKDKATLLITMLHEAGIESYFTLVDSQRGVVNPAVPTPWSFNHAIVAVKLLADLNLDNLYAAVDDPKLGKLLFFDPTSELTAFGTVPAGEQNGYALVVTGNGGEMIKMPLPPPSINRLLRVAHLQLTPEGSLLGEVEETRNGYEASAMRSQLMDADRNKRVKLLEGLLGEFLDRSRLTYASIGNLDKYDEPLILRYKFEALDYAKSAGDLMLVRPRVLGVEASPIAEDKKRKYPVTYKSTSLDSDVIDIKLPAGYSVDELPPAADVTAPFAEYKSKIEAKDNVLYYSRSYTVKDPLVPLEQNPTLRTFMRGIASDERNMAVLKKVQP